MKTLSERIMNFITPEVLEEEQYEIMIPVVGKDAITIMSSLGVDIIKDSSTSDDKGRIFTVNSSPKSGDAITIRQKLDASLKRMRLDPKSATFKVTKA